MEEKEEKKFKNYYKIIKSNITFYVLKKLYDIYFEFFDNFLQKDVERDKNHEYDDQGFSCFMLKPNPIKSTCLRIFAIKNKKTGEFVIFDAVTHIIYDRKEYGHINDVEKLKKKRGDTFSLIIKHFDYIKKNAIIEKENNETIENNNQLDEMNSQKNKNNDLKETIIPLTSTDSLPLGSENNHSPNLNQVDIQLSPDSIRSYKSKLEYPKKNFFKKKICGLYWGNYTCKNQIQNGFCCKTCEEKIYSLEKN